MGELLGRMAQGSARRAASARSLESEAALLERALTTRQPPRLVLEERGFDVVAEVKRRSPALGALGGESVDAAARARAYVAAGACAISVLTEPEEFRGSLVDLAQVSAAVPVPVLRKDFLVSPYQVLEARAQGASGVLLILGILEEGVLREMLDAASRLGLFVLLEAFDARDLERAERVLEDARGLGVTALLGLNARDLDTLAIDASRFERLLPLLPRGVPWVAESGIESAADATRVADLGYRLALVGTALMRQPDPSTLLESMLRHTRTSPSKNIPLEVRAGPPARTSSGSRGGGGRAPENGAAPKEPSLESLPDARGRFGDFGGRFVPETLMPALARLEASAREALHDPVFRATLEHELATWVGRPTPLTEAPRLAREWGAASVLLKREDLAHTGAHKINNALGQALLAARMKARRVIAETGAGQHGVATAAACARLGLPCTVYMGSVDVLRQAQNVDRMIRFGAKVVHVESGDRTLRAAIDEALRDWVSDPEATFYLLGSAVGPHPYPWIVRELQSVIGREARRECLERLGRLPDLAVACVGGGSNSIGLFHPFLEDREVELVGIEAGGRGSGIGENAATLSHGRPGVLHGSYSLLLQDAHGQVVETHSVSAGLDYPGVGPEHAYLRALGRVRYESAGDEEALDATEELSALEGILPALESAHALAGARRLSLRAPGRTILIGLSGRGDKDLATIARERPRHE